MIEVFVGVLLEDCERLGRLERAHVIQVASRRGITPQQLDRTLAVLRSHGLLDGGPAVAGMSRGGPVITDACAAAPARPSSSPRQIGRHRLLSAEEEVQLGRRIQMGERAAQSLAAGEDLGEAVELVQDGHAARRTLVRHNVRLVIDIARRHLPGAGDLDLDDLIQEGVLGLNRAAQKFDPTMGFKFSTYATWWVWQAVIRAIANTGSTVRLPVRVHGDLRRVNRYARGFEERNGRAPTLAELAEGLGEKAGEVRALLDYSAPVVRLDVPVNREGGATLSDLVLASRAELPEEGTIHELLRRQILDTIEAELVGLDPRLARLLEGRFGLDGEVPMTLDALGKEFGCTRERVRQLEKKLFDRLRANNKLRTLTAEYLAMEAVA
ncbi:RNA polymerase sigma factor RpoD/SigA [Kitasatospora sp. NPDC048407]|uniref:sigma-70 family RNA polymerase sigma factor n=1 Tax=Kitasatospora sp. NPDC048407 TaxID=3364051 RepID=UPI003713810F